MALEALRGGVAVLTGSASGLGLACAQEAASHGLHICLTDVRPEALEEAAATLGAEQEGRAHRGGPLPSALSLVLSRVLAASGRGVGGAREGRACRCVPAGAGRSRGGELEQEVQVH